MMRMRIFSTVLLLATTVYSYGQDSISIQKISLLSSDYYDKIAKRLNGIDQQFDRKTEQYLQKITLQEQKIYKKLWKKDSTKAKELFGDINGRYEQLRKQAVSKAQQISAFSKVYSSKLDSLGTAFRFLEKANNANSGVSDNLNRGLSSINSLQNKLDQTEHIRKYLKERRKVLTEQLEKFGMVRELKQFRKQVYYYQQQVEEYKALINDPEKLEGKLLGLVAKLPVFRDFFARHSQVGQLFRQPGPVSSSIGSAGASLPGLQTNSGITQDIQNRFGSGPQVRQMMQQNMGSTRSQLNGLKSKLNEYLPKGGSSDEDMPDFKPNTQKTKSFWKRLELGFNFQNQRENILLPVATDFGFAVGYKLNDKSVVGLGASYRMGWGNDIRHIKISHQGVGLRSFIDWKLKAGFLVSGGYELNYRSAFDHIDQLKEYSNWQVSGLVGLSKVVAFNSNLFKKVQMQLLWDLLSYRELPRTQPFVFRIGYSLN